MGCCDFRITKGLTKLLISELKVKDGKGKRIYSVPSPYRPENWAVRTTVLADFTRASNTVFQKEKITGEGTPRVGVAGAVTASRRLD